MHTEVALYKRLIFVCDKTTRLFSRLIKSDTHLHVQHLNRVTYPVQGCASKESTLPSGAQDVIVTRASSDAVVSFASVA